MDALSGVVRTVVNRVHAHTVTPAGRNRSVDAGGTAEAPPSGDRRWRSQPNGGGTRFESELRCTPRVGSIPTFSASGNDDPEVDGPPGVGEQARSHHWRGKPSWPTGTPLEREERRKSRLGSRPSLAARRYLNEASAEGQVTSLESSAHGARPALKAVGVLRDGGSTPQLSAQ